MRSEDRWTKDQESAHNSYTKGLRKQKGYRQDDTIGKSVEGSVLDNLITTAAVIAGGVFLYRSGALKGAIHRATLEMNNYKGYVPELANAVRRWGKDVSNAPKGSVFRGSTQDDFIRSFVKVMKNPVQAIRGTVSDLGNLSEEFSDSFRRIKSEGVRKELLSNTDLKMAFSRSKEMMEKASESNMNKMKLKERTDFEIYSRYHEDVYKNGILQYNEEVANSLKRRGFRHALLGDIFEKKQGLNGQFQLEMKTGVELNGIIDSNNAEHMAFVRDLTETLKQASIRTKENTLKNMLSDDDIWMNLRLDSNLLIDEAGKMADLRTAYRHFDEAATSIAMDFEVPLLHLNPFRMFGVQDLFKKDRDFALLKANKFNPVITRMSGSDLESRLEKDHFFLNGKVFRFDNGDLNLVADDMVLHKVGTDDSHRGVSMSVDAIAKMSNISNVHFERYEQSDGFKYWYSKLAETLDIGFQNSQRYGEFDALDPMSHINIFNNLHQYAYPWKSHFVKNVADIFGAQEEGFDLFVAARKRTKITDAVLGKNEATLNQVIKEFRAGRHDLENISGNTIGVYHMFERLSSSLSPLGLALSTKSLGSTQDVIANLLLRRVLPVYAGIEAWKYINYESENIFGQEIEDTLADTVVGADIAWHKVKDAIGLTAFAKEITPLLPGGEQISGIPGLGFFDMNETEEERKDFWENGVVPIRKGRFWSLGNTPFTGSKIEYYAPNWYREVKADVEFSDSKYGSEEEYFSRSWMPSLRHPFAPLQRLMDPYYWENKHYYDRPYMMTSPAFADVPILGPILAPTIGQIVKPSKRMHLEYWSSPQEGITNLDMPFIEGGSTISDEAANDFLTTGEALTIPEDQQGLIPTMPMGTWPSKKEAGRKGIYISAGGQTDIVSIPMDVSSSEVNMRLKTDSLSGIKGAYTVMRSKADGMTTIEGVENPYAFNNVMENQYHVLSDIGGIYGFGADTILGIGGKSAGTQIETSGYAYSLNRDFWDLGVGGLGGELSEIYRRFFPKRRRDIDYYNPIRNTMPGWMPGEEYFTDFEHGDPYVKVARGESRLPGEGYERLYGINDPTYMGIGSSFFGKSKSDLIKHFLKEDTITDEAVQDIVDSGSKYHKQIQDQWRAQGFLIDDEVQIKDEAHEVVGYYDARVHDPTSSQGQAIAEIKTVSAKSFEELTDAKALHRSQTNFYLVNTGIETGYIYYYNRDDMTQAPKVFIQQRDEKLYEENIKNLEEARSLLKDALESGKLGRGAFYEYFDRFRILADVAPYSKEYKEYSSMISRMELTDEQRKEATEIRKQVAEKKNALRLYDYRFATADLDYKVVTVDKKITNDMFTIKELPDRPIKFAGIDIPDGSGDTVGATRFVDTIIKPGAKIKIGFNADPLDVIENDTYKSIKAVVYLKDRNINKEMLDSGMAKERETDYSPAAVKARFSDTQIAFGAAWEKIAHMHTFTNTKLLQVRSPYESYIRRDIYGKDFQKWTNPIQDFLIPTIETKVFQDNTIILGAFIGSLFGARRSTYGRLVGAAAGAIVATAGELVKFGSEAGKRTTWIPERRRQEREINEYIDMLKFVKERRLYSQYAAKAKREGVDVEALVKEIKEDGEGNKGRRKALLNAKRDLKVGDESDVKKVAGTIKPKYGSQNMTPKDMIKAINKEIKELGSQRKYRELTPNALKAIEHYQASERTMYGYDPGEPLENLMAGLPKRERRYFQDLLKAPDEEKLKILDVAPKYMRRGLESGWGIEPEEKTNLAAYFSQKQLPGVDWIGWDENVNLDLVKVKMVRKDGLDPGEFDIWEDDIQAADNLGEIPIPHLSGRENPIAVKKRLTELLQSFGMRDIEIQHAVTGGDMDVSLELSYDRRKEMEKLINDRSSKLFE